MPGASQSRQSTGVEGEEEETHSKGGKTGRPGPAGKVSAVKGLSTVLAPDRSSKWPRAMSSEMAARRAAVFSLSKSWMDGEREFKVEFFFFQTRAPWWGRFGDGASAP